ncbi:hypothetical protein HispidOSU_025313 [Sigmodon hispidus]
MAAQDYYVTPGERRRRGQPVPSPAHLRACWPPDGPALRHYAERSMRTAARPPARGSPTARPVTPA